MTTEPARQDTLAVSVRVPASLSALADPEHSMGARVRDAIEEGMRALMRRLGIPGLPVVAIAVGGDDTKLLRIAVDGRPVRFPDELLQQAFCYVHERILDPAATVAAIRDWLAASCDSPAESIDGRRLLQFVRRACVATLEREPSALLGTAQARAIAESIGVEGFEPDAGWIRTTLARVLDLRISVANTDVLADVLVGAWRERLAPGPVAEELIGRLRATSVNILMERASLRDVTKQWATDGPAKFRFLRDGVFDELGLEFPGLRLRIDDGLAPGSFAFRINDVVSMPLFGLRPGQVLVNDTAERLRLQDFEAVPTLSPATGQPNALIDAALEARAEAAGLTTWDPIEYLVLTLAEYLRRNGWCTLHRAGVVSRLDQLADTFPALLKAARARADDSEITQLLRSLMQEGVSTQDHRRILEALVDDAAGLDHRETTSGASPAASRLAAARIALGPAIAQKAARGTDTVVVYLVDPKIERQAIEPAGQVEASEEAILDALGREMEWLPATAQVPRVLTFARSREPLQRLISQQFPRVSVIAHEELPAHMSVQPVARVALATS